MDKSLIRRAPSREPRFTTLETVREYAQERLEDSGEMADARQRHALYCLALAETAEPGYEGRARSPGSTASKRSMTICALPWTAVSTRGTWS